jgi:hypothetical protein
MALRPAAVRDEPLITPVPRPHPTQINDPIQKTIRRLVIHTTMDTEVISSSEERSVEQ